LPPRDQVSCPLLPAWPSLYIFVAIHLLYHNSGYAARTPVAGMKKEAILICIIQFYFFVIVRSPNKIYLVNVRYNSLTVLWNNSLFDGGYSVSVMAQEILLHEYMQN
jgi:hypothetical protein